MRLIDYSTARPSPAAIKAAGYGGVLRYLSTYAPKNLSPAERDGLLAAGLVIGLVWETTANRSAQGSGAGTADARAAEAQADALGYPASCPIFYAVDFGATPGQELPYFAGVLGAARRPVGVYGSASIVEAVPVPWKWQTVAWSGGRVSAQAHIYQIAGAAPIPSTDTNLLLKPVPLWGATTVAQVLAVVPTVSIPAPPALTAAAPLAQEDDDMPTLIFNGTYGSAILDGGRLIGLGDQASVDAFQSAGVRRIAVTDADFLRLRTQTAPGLLLYNAPENGGRGWAYLSGGKVTGVGEQTTVDALKSQGCPVLSLDAAEFARFAG